MRTFHTKNALDVALLIVELIKTHGTGAKLRTSSDDTIYFCDVEGTPLAKINVNYTVSTLPDETFPL